MIGGMQKSSAQVLIIVLITLFSGIGNADTPFANEIYKLISSDKQLGKPSKTEDSSTTYWDLFDKIKKYRKHAPDLIGLTFRRMKIDNTAWILTLESKALTAEAFGVVEPVKGCTKPFTYKVVSGPLRDTYIEDQKNGNYLIGSKKWVFVKGLGCLKPGELNH